MPIEVRRLHPTFFAEISGVNTSSELDEPAITAISRAIDDHAVVVFRDQKLSEVQQIAFARRFGPLEIFTKRLRHDNKHRSEHPEMVEVSNIDETDQLRGAEDRRRIDNLGNQLWHTDSSFRATRGALSMLYGNIVTPKGGETEFADLRAAYDGLSEDMKAMIADLSAEHSRTHARAQIGFTDYSAEEIAALPPVQHRIVHTHPTSGRKTLYLASHASHIVGWRIPEGRLLLRDLMEFATQREFVHRHHWRAGDLVIWDNRCTMHRARPFDESYPRDLRRVTTSEIRQCGAHAG